MNLRAVEGVACGRDPCDRHLANSCDVAAGDVQQPPREFALVSSAPLAVVVLDLPSRSGQQVAQELGERGKFYECDVSNPETMNNAWRGQWRRSAGSMSVSTPMLLT